MKIVVLSNIPAFQLQSADTLTGPDIGVSFFNDVLLPLSLPPLVGGGGGGMVHFSMGGGKEALKTGETEYYIIILTAPRAELSGYGGWREQRRPGVAHRGE
jgi:hypothetical protein